MGNKNQKYGLMTYPGSPKYNVGDYIQSLAAKQYLPRVDQFIEREKLNSYDEESVKMIMNGWYIHNVKQFRPSNKINPLYVSFHLNSHCKNIILGDKNNVEFLKANAPIGCRDYHTVKALQDLGIESYYSGCLTTTLDIKYLSSSKKREKIYFADPLWTLPHWERMMYGPSQFIKGVIKGDVFRLKERDKMLKKIFSNDIISQAEPIYHKLSSSHSEERRFQEAENILQKLSTAKLVVTSRIHAALPCLALKTPVLFINYGLDNSTEISRLHGIVELFNTINIDKYGKISTNFDLPSNRKFQIHDIIENPDTYKIYAEDLKGACNKFIKG